MKGETSPMSLMPNKIVLCVRRSLTVRESGSESRLVTRNNDVNTEHHSLKHRPCCAEDSGTMWSTALVSSEGIERVGKTASVDALR